MGRVEAILEPDKVTMVLPIEVVVVGVHTNCEQTSVVMTIVSNLVVVNVGLINVDSVIVWMPTDEEVAVGYNSDSVIDEPFDVKLAVYDETELMVEMEESTW